ncbi:Ppx/GppA phosphatase family protein [Mucilaginibacter segetis]|uniref:Exopolyphosphatase n=1 Tax=Mucilaginibacter segetis TaxID=2793071 RepID=A0A934PX06_9SPHI|nr:exopolyphosphatase [Mucilaginibacter segetis]MBK0380940.1 exopolyphosphatase [Mucilaginibacter segetis]
MPDKNPHLNNSTPVAVMDLGTNTFHLLIAEMQGDEIKEIHHETEAVKLGEGGINKNIIQPEAFDRGIAAMHKFAKTIEEHKTQKVHAIATSALRNASNGKDFISEVKKQTGLQIKIINGDREATYIYEGIKASGCLSKSPSLIMDIGGGSVEFIICDHHQIYWKHSFEIGAARLMDKFHQQDPIPAASVTDLCKYLDEKLPLLFDAVKAYNLTSLIGSSGAFESFAEVIETEKGHKFNLKTTPTYQFKPGELLQLISRLQVSSHQQRAETKGIIPVRVDMIVVAALITRYMMQQLKLDDVIMSTYSLKEGVMVGMLT